VGRTGSNSWGCEKLYKSIDKKPETDGPRRRWEDNIKVGHKEVGCEGAHWIHVVHNSVLWFP
jgi:hypothetical protein